METWGAETTRSSSSVFGCSGSYIKRMRSAQTRRVRLVQVWGWDGKSVYRIFHLGQWPPLHLFHLRIGLYRLSIVNALKHPLYVQNFLKMRKRQDLDWRFLQPCMSGIRCVTSHRSRGLQSRRKSASFQCHTVLLLGSDSNSTVNPIHAYSSILRSINGSKGELL